MQLQTKVDIKKAPFEINPTDHLLFVGSCFADNIGKRFTENLFHAVVNPYGVMYNPASILHTVEKTTAPVDVAIFTLGTNHVYILNETGEIVDNCQKRPQRLFTESELSVAECTEYLSNAIEILLSRNNITQIVLTISPIRYQKYGFHGSQLSKSTLLIAADILTKKYPDHVSYFPAYEIMNDELRDYRFYQPDMLHPSEQAVDYIYELFTKSFFSKETVLFQEEWQPIKKALTHRPFNPDSEDYKLFLSNATNAKRHLLDKWML